MENLFFDYEISIKHTLLLDLFSQILYVKYEVLFLKMTLYCLILMLKGHCRVKLVPLVALVQSDIAGNQLCVLCEEKWHVQTVYPASNSIFFRKMWACCNLIDFIRNSYFFLVQINLPVNVPNRIHIFSSICSRVTIFGN